MARLRRPAPRLLFLDSVKASAVHHPHCRSRPVRGRFFLELSKLAVEPREVVRLPDPHDSRENVKPSHAEVQPFSQRIAHLSFLGTSCSSLDSAAAECPRAMYRSELDR